MAHGNKSWRKNARRGVKFCYSGGWWPLLRWKKHLLNRWHESCHMSSLPSSTVRAGFGSYIVVEEIRKWIEKRRHNRRQMGKWRTILLIAAFLVVQNLAQLESAKTKRHRPKPTQLPNVHSDLYSEYEDYYEEYDDSNGQLFVNIFAFQIQILLFFFFLNSNSLPF